VNSEGLDTPMGIAIDLSSSGGDLLVADYGNSRILSFSRVCWSNYESSDNLSPCVICPNGSSTRSSYGGDTCFACASGSASFNPGSDCHPCPVTTFAINTTSCVPFPPGTYGQNSPGQSSFSNCSRGTFSTSIGAVSPGTCVQCAPGFYSDVIGAVFCSSCEPGTFSSAGFVSCLDCPLGSYSESKNASSCTFCPVGSFSTMVRANSSTACQVCPQGQYGPSVGAISCIFCPGGTYSNVTGSSSLASCLNCPLNSYSYVGSSNCSACPAGLVAPSGSSFCKSCLSGSVPAASGECSDCPAGSFALAGASACGVCSPGSYSSEGASSCLLCEPGSFGSAVNATDPSTCQPCPVGSYVGGVGNAICDQCPAGYVGSVAGQASLVLACLMCPNNTFSSSKGSVTCSPCHPGSFSMEGASYCTPCPGGSVASLNGCAACTAGTFSQIGSVNCTVCSPGTFSGPKADHCKLCDAGTFRPVPAPVQILLASAVVLDHIHFRPDLQLVHCVPAVLHRQLLIRPSTVVKIVLRERIRRLQVRVTALVAAPASYPLCQHRQCVFLAKQALFSLPVAVVIVFLAQTRQQMHLWGSRLAVPVCLADTLKLLQADVSCARLEQRVWRVTRHVLNVQRDWLLSRLAVRAVMSVPKASRRIFPVVHVCLALKLDMLLMVRAHVSLVLLAHIQLLYLVFNVQLVFGANWP
jgi:hypothetical protein